MTDVWSERAEAYRESDAHREGRDLELFAEWAEGREALDVATGGGNVARILRDAGLEVVTIDSAPGMQPTVVSRAEEIPFADSTFDVVACRVAAHHFQDPSSSLKRDGPRQSRAGARLGQPVHGRSRRGGGPPARPDARPELLRGRVARDVRSGEARSRGVRARGQADRLRGVARPIGHAGRRQRPDPRAARRPGRGRQAPPRARHLQRTGKTAQPDRTRMASQRNLDA